MIVSVVAVAVLAIAVPKQGGNKLDQTAEKLMQASKSEGLTALFELFSHLGSTVAIIVITLIGALLIAWKRGWISGISIIVGVGIAYTLNVLLKMWIDRERPVAAWGIEADGSSFPSGNAMLAVMMFGLMALYTVQDPSVRRSVKTAAGIISILLIVMIGLSRVYFHVHYITDIVAGYASGLAVVSTMTIIRTTWNKNRGAV